MKIWVHTIVKNEDLYIWYSLNSVIRYVDKIMVWDTGSTDTTVKIIKEAQKIYGDRIVFREIISGGETPQGHTDARQKMLAETEADWILVLDGDEVWWEEGIKTLVETINLKGNSLDCLVVRHINLAGDIFHFQEEAASRYFIAGKKGNLNLRAFSTKIPGLHLEGAYPFEGYFDKKSIPLQERNNRKIAFLDMSYLHFTHLPRSTNTQAKVLTRADKAKFEIGKPFPFDFYYPESFFRSRPEIVPSPWRELKGSGLFMAKWQTPLRKLKRKIFK